MNGSSQRHNWKVFNKSFKRVRNKDYLLKSYAEMLNWIVLDILFNHNLLEVGKYVVLNTKNYFKKFILIPNDQQIKVNE